MNKYEPSSKSPYWEATTKTVVGLAVVAALGVLLYFLRPVAGPLLLAFVLSYLLYPVVYRFSRLTRLSWGFSVNIVYLIFLILLLGFFAAAGLALLQQIQSLIDAANQLVNNLPRTISALPGQILVIGPFQFNLSHLELDVDKLVQQGISYLRPWLGQTGTVLGAIATGTASFFGWAAFILLIAYFILSEGRKQTPQETLPFFELPGYNYDFYRIGRELQRTWNAFLRGQIILVMIAWVVDATVLTAFGVRYALALGLLAGLGRFVPYLGQFINVTVTGLVAFFQGSNYLGLEPTSYALFIVAWVILLDTAMDNLVSPRVIGQSLGLHPAAVLVTALLGAQLIGFPGLILAAPVLASLRLLGRYVSRKMLNADPWREPDIETPPIVYPWTIYLERFRQWLQLRLRR